MRAVRNLLVGDRLVPHAGMLNITIFDEATPPFDLLFWRATADAKGKISDHVINRCPLFQRALGTSPARTLAVDTLHSVNYGPMQRWCSAAVWRVLLSNPWHYNGTMEQRMEMAARRLRSDLFSWYNETQVPHARRLNDFTLSMIGHSAGIQMGECMPHPGCAMKTKAAETAVIMDWAIDLVRKYQDGLTLGAELLVAGDALQKWTDVVLSQTLLADHRAQQQLLDLAVKDVLRAERAQVSMVPAHHCCTL